jgi:O-antigen/teichoic acid export membrane protein
MNTSQRSLLSSVVNGMTWIGAGIVAQVTMRIGVLAVMARLVSPREFGLVAIAFIFTSFAERLGQVGVGAAFVQRATIDDDDLRTASILSVVSGFSIAGALCAIAPLASSFFGEHELTLIIAVLALGFIFDSFGVVSDGLLQRELKFREIVKVETASFVFGLGAIGIILGFLGWGVWALVVANLAMRASKTALLLWVMPIPRRGSWSGVRARALLSTGIGFSAGKVLNFLSLQGDNFVVGRLLGAEALGMYTRAYQAMTLPAMYVGQAFERVLFPALSQKQDDTAALRKGLLSTLEISTLVALPISVGMYFLSPEIVLVLFGSGWRPVIPVLTVLSCGVFFRAAYKCSDVLIRSKGDVYAYAMRQACYTGVIVGGSLIGALLNGTQGVAYAVVSGVIVNYVLMTRLAGRLAQVTLRELVRCHLPGIWVSVWVGVYLFVTIPSIRAAVATPVAVLGIATVGGVGIALIAWLLSGPLSHGSFVNDTIAHFLRRRREAIAVTRASP